MQEEVERWGLLPHWAKDSRIAFKMINARAETLPEKPAYRGLLSPASLSEAQRIEWEDDMLEVNRITTPANVRWKLVDRETAAENAAIDWRFRVGDEVKIRLVNEMDSDHPMPTPSTCMGQAASSSSPETAWSNPTSSGRTPSSSGQVRRSTSS